MVGGGDLARGFQRDRQKRGQWHGIFFGRRALPDGVEMGEAGIADALAFMGDVGADRGKKPRERLGGVAAPASPVRLAWPAR